jgi:hypothetical protein
LPGHRRCVQREVVCLKIFGQKNLLPKLCKLIYFEPFLKHSLVTQIFDLETYILVGVLGIPKIKHAEKMVKICQKGLLKLKFEIIPKQQIFRFCP